MDVIHLAGRPDWCPFNGPASSRLIIAARNSYLLAAGERVIFSAARIVGRVTVKRQSLFPIYKWAHTARSGSRPFFSSSSRNNLISFDSRRWASCCLFLILWKDFFLYDDAALYRVFYRVTRWWWCVFGMPASLWRDETDAFSIWVGVTAALAPPFVLYNGIV